MITGFAISSAVMDPLVELYGTRLRCITYDHPGSGRSSRRSLSFTTAQLAASATRVLDELGIESAHVAGLSMGGVVAQELALRFPHRVRGLILVSTSAGSPLSALPDPRRLMKATASVLRGSAQRGRLWLGPAVFSPDFMERYPEHAEALLRPTTLHPATPWGIVGQFCAVGLHDRALDLQRIRAPTLVLHGERDILVPAANAHRLADGIPDAELHVLEGMGHALNFERPDEAFSLICDWLDRRQPVAGEPPSPAAARAERLTRPLAAHAGALRVARSSVVLGRRALASLARQASDTSSR